MKNMILLIALAGLIACKKNGTGGSTDVVAFTAHHSKPIFGSTVYVKFDARELPQDPTGNYDLVIAGEPNEDHVHIPDLLPGNYFLYATGFDSTIKQPVKGGVPLNISRKDKKKELEVDIAVSE